MMCQRMGCPPTSTSGLGLISVISLRRVPTPPAKMTAFIFSPDTADLCSPAYTCKPFQGLGRTYGVFLLNGAAFVLRYLQPLAAPDALNPVHADTHPAWCNRL